MWGQWSRALVKKGFVTPRRMLGSWDPAELFDPELQENVCFPKTFTFCLEYP